MLKEVLSLIVIGTVSWRQRWNWMIVRNLQCFGCRRLLLLLICNLNVMWNLSSILIGIRHMVVRSLLLQRLNFVSNTAIINRCNLTSWRQLTPWTYRSADLHWRCVITTIGHLCRTVLILKFFSCAHRRLFIKWGIMKRFLTTKRHRSPPMMLKLLLGSIYYDFFRISLGAIFFNLLLDEHRLWTEYFHSALIIYGILLAWF